VIRIEPGVRAEARLLDRLAVMPVRLSYKFGVAR
jgi:hypothetical protein